MGSAAAFGSLGHLAGRFFGALSPAGPSPADEAWALGWLLPGEQDLWRRMSGPDRRHAVGVARDTLVLLADGNEPPGREVVASALLHDVGKVESGFGTFARVAITVAAMVFGRGRLAGLEGEGSEGRQGEGSEGRPSGLRARVRLYLTHDRVGAELLRRAGSGHLTVSWAREHHLDPARWTVERRFADALKAADGD